MDNQKEIKKYLVEVCWVPESWMNSSRNQRYAPGLHISGMTGKDGQSRLRIQVMTTRVQGLKVDLGEEVKEDSEIFLQAWFDTYDDAMTAANFFDSIIGAGLAAALPEIS